MDNAPLANPPALPRLVFVHHAGIADALIPSGSRGALYADMKLGATPGFIGISRHETRSLLHGGC
jgi:hypothetical protein